MKWLLLVFWVSGLVEYTQYDTEAECNREKDKIVVTEEMIGVTCNPGIIQQ